MIMLGGLRAIRASRGPAQIFDETEL